MGCWFVRQSKDDCYELPTLNKKLYLLPSSIAYRRSTDKETFTFVGRVPSLGNKQTPSLFPTDL